jgi:hypothetical protein
MSEEIDAAGQRVFEMFGAVAGAPDDEETWALADAALAALDALLETA